MQQHGHEHFNNLLSTADLFPVSSVVSFSFLSQISEKKTEIEYLQHSLQSCIQKANMLETVTQSNTDIKPSDEEVRLTQEINQLKIQLNNLILENKKAERELQEVNLSISQ